MKLSFIVVCRNAAATIEDCMQSVARDAALTESEVIVVDNNSTDNTRTLAKAGCPSARVIANGSNRGFAAAVNQGIAVADGDLYILVNPHAKLRPGAALRLAEFMDETGRCGVAGAKVVPEGGHSAPTTNRFPCFWGRLARFVGLGCSEKRSQYPYTAHWVPDVLVAVRPELLTSVGPIDERFFVGYELADLCRRAWKSQAPEWQVWCVPVAQTDHVGGSGTQAQQASHPAAAHVMRMRYRSLALYLGKHHGKTSVTGYLLLEALAKGLHWVGHGVTGQAAKRKADGVAAGAALGAISDTFFGTVCPPRPW